MHVFSVWFLYAVFFLVCDSSMAVFFFASTKFKNVWHKSYTLGHCLSFTLAKDIFDCKYRRRQSKFKYLVIPQDELCQVCLQKDQESNFEIVHISGNF